MRNYCLNVLKVKKIAVIGDTTGYGVTAVGASVAAFKKDGADVVYQANIDATQPDMTPDMLARKECRHRSHCGMERHHRHGSAMFNTRAAMNWDVAFVGHPSLASGELAGLVEKPENWKKVYAIGLQELQLRRRGQAAAEKPGTGRSPAQSQCRAQGYAVVVGRRRHRRDRAGRQGRRRERIAR